MPTLDNKGLDSTISSHFGQAAGFLILNDETNEMRFIQGSVAIVADGIHSTSSEHYGP